MTDLKIWKCQMTITDLQVSSGPAGGWATLRVWGWFRGMRRASDWYYFWFPEGTVLIANQVEL